MMPWFNVLNFLERNLSQETVLREGRCNITATGSLDDLSKYSTMEILNGLSFFPNIPDFKPWGRTKPSKIGFSSSNQALINNAVVLCKNKVKILTSSVHKLSYKKMEHVKVVGALQMVI